MFMVQKVIEASNAVAEAVRLSRVKVIPMYPITPQTHIVEKLAEMINNGDLEASMIPTESEHSAASALFGAQATGVRTFTATASQGLAYMFEMLPIISGNRMPCVMAVANRALSAPINIWNDHSDAVSARDQGWLKLYVESSQEALDTTIQAYKISENFDVLLPTMICLDGFTLSHVYEIVEMPEQEKVDKYLPAYKPFVKLDPENPVTIGPVAFPDTFMEFKYEQQKAINNSAKIIEKANADFEKIFGRSYGNGLLDLYRMEDAEYAIIGMGTLCGTARKTVDKLREQNKKVGLIKIRSYRPFPAEQLIKAAKNLKGIAVIDRHISLGNNGPLFEEVRSAVYGNAKDIFVNGFIAGLGGRDITIEHLNKALEMTMKKENGVWLF